MIRKFFLFIVFLFVSAEFCQSQSFVKTSDLFPVTVTASDKGSLSIMQEPAVDTLLSRYILSCRNLKTYEGRQGMKGFRIQLYYNNSRNSKEESAKANADFINKFHDIVSYVQFSEPNYFRVRAGNYRTKAEAYKYLVMIRHEFPNAYLVPDVINFPDLISK